MKALLLSALVALSIGINLLLVFGLFAPAKVAPLLAPLGVTVTDPVAGPTAPALAPRDRARTPAANARPATWAELDSDDPATLVDNLRAAGFSDEEIRGILRAKLAEGVEQIYASAFRGYEPTPYWQPRTGSPLSSVMLDPELRSQVRQQTLANNRLIESLLGPDPLSEGSLAQYQQRLQFGDLSDAKIEMMQMILSDYSELSSGIRSGAQGIYLPEDQAKLELLAQEQEADIRALLTPAEYEEYLYRGSTTGNRLRSTLAEFDPTESEYRAIFALQYEFDQRYDLSTGPLGPTAARERAEAQQQLTEQIKTALGPERAAEYERSIDGTYRQAVQLVQRLELPKERAITLYEMQKDIQERATAIRASAGRGGDQQQLISALTELQQEATMRALNALGGDRGLQAYKEGTTGAWIDRLVPTVSPRGGAGGRGVIVTP